MARRYQYHSLRVVRADGSGFPGASVTVRRLSDGKLATLYAGDNLSGGTKSNPMNADGNGFVSFFAGDLKDNYSISVPAGAAFTYLELTADTVENHRQTGEHADGTITANMLADGIIGSTTDVTLHSAKVRDVHGVPNSLGTEGFAYSSVGGTTNDPTFGDVTADTLTLGELLGYTVVTDPSGTGLADAVAAASAGDTLLIPSGAWTVTSGVTLNEIRLQGFGSNVCKIGMTSGSSTIVTLGTTFAELRGIAVIHTGSGIACEVTSGARISDCRLLAGTGPGVRVSGTLDDFRMYDTTITGGLTVAASAVSLPLTFRDCKIYGDVSFTTPTTNAIGGSISECIIVGDLTVSTPNLRFTGNVVSGDATFASTSYPCLFPTNGNVVLGTITNPVYALGFSSWPYQSGWIEVDNSAAGKTDEYFYVGDSGIGSSFAHGLATRKLEFMVQVANTSGGSDEIWPIYPTVHGAAGTLVTPGANAFSVHIIDANNVRLVMYAGDAQTGSGTTASSSQIIFNAVDSQAIVSGAAGTQAAYNYGAAGARSLDHVWVKLFARPAFSA